VKQVHRKCAHAIFDSGYLKTASRLKVTLIYVNRTLKVQYSFDDYIIRQI